MEQTLQRYVALYNHQLPQSALGSKTPMQAMKQWYQERPDLFHKRPYDRPGCDNYVVCVAACSPEFDTNRRKSLICIGRASWPATTTRIFERCVRVS